jgi:hypothetical protein
VSGRDTGQGSRPYILLYELGLVVS